METNSNISPPPPPPQQYNLQKKNPPKQTKTKTLQNLP
jgi:hypothetical protein